MLVQRVLSVASIGLILAASSHAQNQTEINFDVDQWVGIDEANPNISSNNNLDYMRCSTGDKQALFRHNIIGNGDDQVPSGAIIVSAALRLTAQIGGDGFLYRAGEPWSSSDNWNSLGDVLTAGSPIGVGMSTGQSMEIDVTDHVQAWANGTFNAGWVIKGLLDDCTAARIHNGASSTATRTRLRVTYQVPDTTGSANHQSCHWQQRCRRFSR